MENILSINGYPGQVHFQWDASFNHATVLWRGANFADLIYMAPCWYLITNSEYRRYRTEAAAKSHIHNATKRAEGRYIAAHWRAL